MPMRVIQLCIPVLSMYAKTKLKSRFGYFGFYVNETKASFVSSMPGLERSVIALQPGWFFN